MLRGAANWRLSARGARPLLRAVGVACFVGIPGLAAAETAVLETSTSSSEPEPRLSLPTQTDEEAWQTSGIRVQLGILLDASRGQRPAPDATGTGLLVRPQLRLDASWTLALGLQYATYSAGKVSGFRWSTTIESTLHPWRGLTTAVGLGIGGLALSARDSPGSVPAELNPADEPGRADRDIAASTPLDRCDGLAVVGLFRLEYAFLVGPLFATGPMLQGAAQWTTCTAENGQIDDDGAKVVSRQAWRALSVGIGWSLWWR